MHDQTVGDNYAYLTRVQALALINRLEDLAADL